MMRMGWIGLVLLVAGVALGADYPQWRNDDPALTSEVVGILRIALKSDASAPILKADAIDHLGRLGPDAGFAVDDIKRLGTNGRFSALSRAALKRISPDAAPVAPPRRKPTLTDGDDDLDLGL